MAKRKAGKKGAAPSSAPTPRGKKKGKPASGGPIRAVCRFLGSAELAVALLMISVAVLAWATLLESARGSEIAQWYFYHSQWFIALMALMTINVLTAMLFRWPWKKRHIGFLVTHFGLIVLLGGSIWSFAAGIEGRLTFAEGETVDTIVVSDRSQLTMSWREGGSRKELVFTFAPGPVDWPVEEPLDFGESDGFRVKVLRFYRHARREVSWIEDASARSVPALRVALVGPGGAPVIEQWLTASRFAGEARVGTARLALHKVPIRSMLDDLLSPPTELGAKGLLSVYHKDQVRHISVDDKVGKKVSIGDDGTEVEIAAYIPDAKPGAGGKFISAGEAPRNPMLELRVQLPEGREPLRQIAFAKAPFVNLDGVHGPECPVKFLYSHPDVPAQAGTEFFETPDGKLYCRIGTAGRYQSRGEVSEGDQIEALAGLEVRLLEHVRHARREVTFQPVALAPGETEAPEAAALFEIAAGGETHRMWLQRGGRQRGLQGIQTPKGPVAVSFGYAQRPLGYSLRLVDFKRGTNPGGMGDASYASAVELEDESLGLTRKRTISMNEPLTHGKFTFYQAGFDRTTGGREVSRLSVAYDPGRFLKYSGCLMMCVGTYVMFYLKGRTSKKGRSAAAPSQGTDQVRAD
jgi:hypothetical protein